MIRVGPRTRPGQRHRLLREGSGNPVCGVPRCLMLPDPDHGPSGCAELSLVETITFDVSSDLRAPISGIGSWTRSVLRTSVPEAAIDEDSNLLATEDDVGPAVQALQWSSIDSIPEATPMQLRPEGKLRASVALPIALHDRSGGGRRGRGRFGNDGASSRGARSIGAAF